MTNPDARKVYADRMFKRRQQLGSVPGAKKRDGVFKKRNQP